MKQWFFLVVMACLILSLVACSNQTQSDLKQFEQSKKDVDQKEAHVEKLMDEMRLNRLTELSRSDLTDRNRDDFEQMATDMDNKLMPAFNSYKKAAEDLSAKSKKVQKLRTEYLREVYQQEKALKSEQTFIHLCNDSIKANEDILNYTRLFEKRRAQLEAQVKEAKDAGETKSADALTSKLKDNNKDLQKVAEKYLNASQEDKAQTVIKDKIQPLISKQIDELNQSDITEPNTSKARQRAIEMYYSLHNYYETREKTITISEKMEHYDTDQLPLTGKSFGDYHKQYKGDLKALKQEINKNN